MKSHQHYLSTAVLSSGLPVYLYETNDEVAGILVMVRAGTLTEKQGIYGISHFLEHLMFEGTKNRTAMEISSAIENKGGEINAATGSEYTLYYIKIQRKDLPLAIRILGDMMSNPLFEKKAIEKERAIILSEIAMVYDEPRHYRWVLLEKGLFHGTKRAIPAYGKKEDVQRIQRNDLLAYYHRYYQAKNMMIVLVGKELMSLLPLVEQSFSLPAGTPARIMRKNPSPYSLEEQRQMQQSYLFYGIPTPSRKQQAYIVYDVIRAILGKPLSGWIYKELRIKRSIGYDASVHYDPGIWYGMLAISSSCKPEQIPLVKQILVQQWKRLQNVSQRTVQQAKDFLLGERALYLHDPIHRAEEIALAALAGSLREMTAYESLLKEVTPSLIAKTARHAQGIWALLKSSS